MYQVAIIGAGQLGSRHLQGLKTASSSMKITVMDSSEESLRIAKERYETVETVGEKLIQYVNSIEELPLQIDLVIIATGSKPRAVLVKNLLNHSTVKYMILEKVLFTRLSDYDEIGVLLRDKNVRSWVNCPRRTFGSYNYLKDKLDYSMPIKMEFAGNDWGLCCNSMHFIDVFMFLTQEDDYTIISDGVENKVYESKRPGYVEMYGTIKITTPKGNELLLSSSLKFDQQSRVEIKNGLNYYALNEIEKVLIIDGKEINVVIPYQSQTSGILADGILNVGFCPLPSYEKSAHYHKIFIANLLEKYNQITGGDSKELPIT